MPECSGEILVSDDGKTFRGGPMATVVNGAADLGLRSNGTSGVDATRLYGRIKALARAQSADVAARVAAEGVEVVAGTACLAGPGAVRVGDRDIAADAVLIAPGAHPRVLPDSVPDGERILTGVNSTTCRRFRRNLSWWAPG